MKILVLDIETTGLNSKKHMILELGMCELDLETGFREPLYDKLFKEHRFCEDDHNAWIFANGFMKVEELENAKPIAESLEEIQKIISSYKYATAWNSDFDVAFMENAGIKFNKVLPDPMKLTTGYFKLPGRYGYKWPKAQEAHDKLFPEETKIEAHRGLDDAMMESKIIYQLYKNGAIWKNINFVPTFFEKVTKMVNTTYWNYECNTDDFGADKCIEMLDKMVFTVDHIKQVVSADRKYHNPSITWEQKWKWLRTSLSELVDLPEHSDNLFFF